MVFVFQVRLHKNAIDTIVDPSILRKLAAGDVVYAKLDTNRTNYAEDTRGWIVMKVVAPSTNHRKNEDEKFVPAIKMDTHTSRYEVSSAATVQRDFVNFDEFVSIHKLSGNDHLTIPLKGQKEPAEGTYFGVDIPAGLISLSSKDKKGTPVIIQVGWDKIEFDKIKIKPKE